MLGRFVFHLGSNDRLLVQEVLLVVLVKVAYEYVRREEGVGGGDQNDDRRTQRANKSGNVHDGEQDVQNDEVRKVIGEVLNALSERVANGFADRHFTRDHSGQDTGKEGKSDARSEDDVCDEDEQSNEQHFRKETEQDEIANEEYERVVSNRNSRIDGSINHVVFQIADKTLTKMRLGVQGHSVVDKSCVRVVACREQESLHNICR